MKKSLTGNASVDAAFKALFDEFSQRGHSIAIAGGAVRDILSGKTPNDYDFATTATPEEVKEILMDSKICWTTIDTGIDHGTITAYNTAWGDFEITTLREDVETDGRHAKVKFTNSWHVDASRRDFTINSMFLTISGEIVDFFNGQNDLKEGRVTFVGNAHKRVEEDALRMIRLVRMACKFDCPIVTLSKCNVSDVQAILDNSDAISKVSCERLWAEWVKVCKDNPENAHKFLLLLSVLHIKGNFIVTNADRLLNLDKEYIEKYPEVAIATQFDNEDDLQEFVNNFKLSNKQVERMKLFLKWGIQIEWDDFTCSIAEDLINNDVSKDFVKAIACYHRNGFVEDSIDDIKYTKFPVSGKDLIAIGMKPGPDMGETLAKLKQLWIDSRYIATKDILLNTLKDTT